MKKISLDGAWELKEKPLGAGTEAAAAVMASPKNYDVPVPGDVSAALIAAGQMAEPLTGTNFFTASPRIYQSSWWFSKTFIAPARDFAAGPVMLHLDGLDVGADIWLNGKYLGHHASAFYPFRRDVRPELTAGRENTVLVRLTTGRERCQEREDFVLLSTVPGEGPRGYPERGFPQRVYLRKPAYTWGWDWSPHMPTCGITLPCWIEYHQRTEIAAVELTAEEATAKKACIRAQVEIARDTERATAFGELTLTLTDESGKKITVKQPNLMVRSGRTFVDFRFTLDRPRLWWPNGAGAPHRYTVNASLILSDGEKTAAAPSKWGCRTVRLDSRPGVFRFVINNQPLFIKGGNWIPCEHIHGRTTAEKLTSLVGEAAAANLNTLRVWGGGRFEREEFYEACDAAGIMLWHDFMSACAPLPADEPGFAETFLAEARYQIRRLYNRACLLLWCGNNEVAAAYEWQNLEARGLRDPAWRLYFEDLPELLRTLAPDKIYLPSSPYGGESTGDSRTGDDHHWVVMRPEEKYWSCPEYWDKPEVSIFNSEYGYGGPCSYASTCDYLGTPEPNLFDETGRQHTNTFYDIARVNFSIKEHYGEEPGNDIRRYIMLGGLCQGLNLGYSLESMRANSHTDGAIFWMYNDAWGENGWTIIDYYLRRKISYYGVKRSLEPCRLLFRRGGAAFGGREDKVLLIAINDTPDTVTAKVAAGCRPYCGGGKLRKITVTVPAYSKTVAAEFPLPAAAELAAGTLVALPETEKKFAPVFWHHCRVKDGHLPAASPQIIKSRIAGNDLRLTVTTDNYAHAVYFSLPETARCSDCWFDLPAGCMREITVYGGASYAGSALDVFCYNQRQA